MGTLQGQKNTLKNGEDKLSFFQTADPIQVQRKDPS